MPDKVLLWPAVQDTRIDGTINDNFTAFNRGITINFGVVQEKDDRRYIYDWYRSNNNKSIEAYGETIPVVCFDPSGYSVDWVDGNEGLRTISVDLIEKTARNTIPDAWL